jgi:host factor-I protein
MATENPQRLQDTFLDHLLSKRVPVTVFLINGVKLQGLVTAHDSFCIMLSRDGQSQAIYKQAVSTIAPSYAIDLWGGDKDGDEAGAQPAPAPRPRAADIMMGRREKVVVVERKTRPRRPV